MEIRFRVWPSHKPEQDEWLVKRIALLVNGNNEVFIKESGYKWQLGGANDWKMDKDLETGEFIVSYRYGHGRKKEMEALGATIIFILGLQEYNK